MKQQDIKKHILDKLPIGDVSISVCTNCGSPWVIKTYDGHWCKHCKTEL